MTLDWAAHCTFAQFSCTLLCHAQDVLDMLLSLKIRVCISLFYTVQLCEIGTLPVGTILRFALIPLKKIGTLLRGGDTQGSKRADDGDAIVSGSGGITVTSPPWQPGGDSGGGCHSDTADVVMDKPSSAGTRRRRLAKVEAMNKSAL